MNVNYPSCSAQSSLNPASPLLTLAPSLRSLTQLITDQRSTLRPNYGNCSDSAAPFPLVRITCVDGADARRPFCFSELDDFVTRAFPCTVVVDLHLPGGRPRGRFGVEASLFLVAGCAFGGRPRGRLGVWGVEVAGAGSTG